MKNRDVEVGDRKSTLFSILIAILSIILQLLTKENWLKNIFPSLRLYETHLLLRLYFKQIFLQFWSNKNKLTNVSAVKILNIYVI